MLKRVTVPRDVPDVGIPIGKAAFPSPFVSGLEYASPARGTWNIVHTGMLIPEAHEIFVCAASCLRGVVLTAAELGMAHRFSTVEIREWNLLEGDMEQLLIEGVSDILQKLPKKPPVVLVYTSCVHHFAGCDLDMIYDELRLRHPDIDFVDCYMNPIMRKSGMTPDQIIGDVESVFRLMDLLDKLEERERKILEMRFGLKGGRALTLEEVSQEIGRTRERVRQIQNQALAKLKQLLADESGFNSNSND